MTQTKAKDDLDSLIELTVKANAETFDPMVVRKIDELMYGTSK